MAKKKEPKTEEDADAYVLAHMDEFDEEGFADTCLAVLRGLSDDSPSSQSIEELADQRYQEGWGSKTPTERAEILRQGADLAVPAFMDDLSVGDGVGSEDGSDR